jgi:hypothetical protein
MHFVVTWTAVLRGGHPFDKFLTGGAEVVCPVSFLTTWPGSPEHLLPRPALTQRPILQHARLVPGPRAAVPAVRGADTPVTDARTVEVRG